MVGRRKELGIAEGLQRADAQDDLFASRFSSIDLPIQLTGQEFSRSRFDLVPIGPQADELKRIPKQCLQRGAWIQAKGSRLERAEADPQEGGAA